MSLRAEFVVNAVSEFTAKIGLELALKKIEQGDKTGTASIPRHGVTVQWRLVEVIQATDVSTGSLIPEDPAVQPFADSAEPSEPPSAPPPPAKLPDITKMDIEEARGVIVVTSDLDDLAALEAIEADSDRHPGGRKGVLKTIKMRRVELEVAAQEKLEAEKAAANPDAAKTKE